MNGEKAFVVAPDQDTYHAIIAAWNLEPGLCFWAETPERAALDIITNHRNGCAAAMWTVAGRWKFDLEVSRRAALERREREAA